MWSRTTTRLPAGTAGSIEPLAFVATYAGAPSSPARRGIAATCGALYPW